MNDTIKRIVTTTETILKCRHDESLLETNAARLHSCLGEAVMLSITEQWSVCRHQRAPLRKAYYFSAEYLMGRLVYSNLYNLGILEDIRIAFARKGVDLAILEEVEDAALGNGGLGRLAACFLDSAATLNLPLSGYGLRYRFGLFKQRFEHAAQKEMIDDWTRFGDPWSYRRDKDAVRVIFADQTVIAVPYDMPIIGYRNGNIGTLRLWQCEAVQELDFEAFNAQDYYQALAEKNAAENITRVLYPNDTTQEGKQLRIKQQYVLSSASLQDILHCYQAAHGDNWANLAAFCAIQLNDTHPALSIPELIRLLMERGLEFDAAFELTQRVFSYTNHTVMSEALEKWDMALLRSVVPEVCAILERIDAKLKAEHPDGSLFIIRDNTVHMAYLSVYMSSSVNGVAQIHSNLLKRNLFRDWYAEYPERFQNKTNGITPRRWLGLSNPELTTLITKEIGSGFLTDLDRLSELKNKINNDLITRFNRVKLIKKQQLCDRIWKSEHAILEPHFIFDVQVKRLHEYKRQLLNAFSIMAIYFDLKDGKLPDFTPTAFLFGAKAAPGYDRAKAVIRYINRISELINHDPSVNKKMQVLFLQNYNCSYAEQIIPAADISEQISPAGTEASGTGNMKLMLNGAVTLGTLDGANVEIIQQAGLENNYIFGSNVEELEDIRDSYDPKSLYFSDPQLKRVVDTLVDGTIETDGKQQELHTALLDGASWHRADHYFHLKDFPSYLEAKLQANRDYQDRLAFGRKCLENIASAGTFSSDRTIRQYAEQIWHI